VQSGSVSMLSDKFKVHIGSLIACCIVVQILLQKLDPASHAKWEERLKDPAFVNLIPTWESMEYFLKQRCRTLEKMDIAMTNYAPGNQVTSIRFSNRSAFVPTNFIPCICAFSSDVKMLTIVRILKTVFLRIALRRQKGSYMRI